MPEIYNSASNLPKEWDSFVGSNIYLKRGFLDFLSKVQNLSFIYCVFRYDGKINSIIVTHKSLFDINMFTDKKPVFKKFANLVYLPLSISRPSLILGSETKAEAEKYLMKLPGWNAIINTPEELKIAGFSSGYTCPRCTLDVHWNSFDEYLSSFRSGYRRRCNQAVKKSSPLVLNFLKDNALFDDVLYGQYLQVLENSRIRLEKLNIDFFRDSRFRIMTASLNNEKVGFLQLLENGSELIFEFVGFEHSLNARYDIYHRFLLEIIKYGIEHKFKTIDFGQTADDAKLKLGCGYTFLRTHLRHKNPVINLGIKLMINKMQYRFDKEPGFNVFKEKQP